MEHNETSGLTPLIVMAVIAAGAACLVAWVFLAIKPEPFHTSSFLGAAVAFWAALVVAIGATRLLARRTTRG